MPIDNMAAERVSFCTEVYHNKVQVKPSLCFNLSPSHEDVRVNGGIAPSIFILGTKWM